MVFHDLIILIYGFKKISLPKASKDNTGAKIFRPISMLPAIGKVFEKKIETRIRDYCEKNRKLCGFRKGKSTIHPLAILQNKINENLNVGNITSVLLLDIQAFDCVWYSGSIHKMMDVGIDLRHCKLVYNLLRHRKFRVNFNGQFSEIKDIPYGIPQGSTVSPLAFIIYTNDMPTLQLTRTNYS